MLADGESTLADVADRCGVGVSRDGCAPRDGRLGCAVPHGPWHTTTLLCGLRTTGWVAPLMLDGAIDRTACLACIEHFLVPTLMPGDVVGLDSLSSYKLGGGRGAVERWGQRCPICRATART